MDAWTRYAWILLAIRPTDTTRADLCWRAAALNKASPDDGEIDEAVGWLRKTGLIAVSAGGLVRTAAGQKVVEEEWTTTSMYETWDRVAKRLRTLLR